MPWRYFHGYSHTIPHGISRRNVGVGHDFPLFFFWNFFGAHLFFLGTGQGGGRKISLQCPLTEREADGQSGQNVRRHSLDRFYASISKQKQNQHCGSSSSGDAAQ